MFEMFSLRGRTPRLGFLGALAFAGAAEAAVALAVTTFQANLSPDEYYLLMAAAISPFAWVLMAATIRRLQDVGWSWMVALPMIPIYFLPLWIILLNPLPEEARIPAVALAVYFVVVAVVLSTRKGAAEGSVSGLDAPAPSGAFVQCRNGHLYNPSDSAVCPYCPAQAVTPPSVTSPPVKPEPPAFHPVVGWLVVIDGPSRGADYRIYPQRNRIGRDTSMEVVLADATVAAVDHASVIYDPLRNQYSLAPGSGKVELGGLPIIEPIPLQAYDRLRVGATTLIVVPVCTYHRWNF